MQTSKTNLFVQPYILVEVFAFGHMHSVRHIGDH